MTELKQFDFSSVPYELEIQVPFKDLSHSSIYFRKPLNSGTVDPCILNKKSDLKFGDRIKSLFTGGYVCLPDEMNVNIYINSEVSNLAHLENTLLRFGALNNWPIKSWIGREGNIPRGAKHRWADEDEYDINRFQFAGISPHSAVAAMVTAFQENEEVFQVTSQSTYAHITELGLAPLVHVPGIKEQIEAYQRCFGTRKLLQPING